MAEAAFVGAAGKARILPAIKAGPDDLLAAGGYLFACPENLGSMSGTMKDLFERCYYPLLGLIEGRPYASMIAAGSDGRGAQAQLDRIVTGWRLRRVADPLIAMLGAQTPAQIAAEKALPSQIVEQCRDLGAALGEGIEQGIF
ncbi:MAG: flavodoxin family protein [Novosphingobium sp.]|nr:NAD(P)H-dependent oxidoreductase [Novosphingobium sp.]MCC6925817.1 flavodoxin family protein [Novosphingobium sp.]